MPKANAITTSSIGGQSEGQEMLLKASEKSGGDFSKFLKSSDVARKKIEEEQISPGESRNDVNQISLGFIQKAAVAQKGIGGRSLGNAIRQDRQTMSQTIASNIASGVTIGITTGITKQKTVNLSSNLSSSFKSAQNAKTIAESMIPGHGSHKKGSVDLSRLPAIKPVATKGIDLNAATALNTDGSPIIRDSEGNARSANSSVPESSLATFLKDEADDNQIENTKSTIVKEQLKKAGEPASAKEAYAQKNEQLKTSNPAKFAENIKNKMQNTEAVFGKNINTDTKEIKAETRKIRSNKNIKNSVEIASTSTSKTDEPQTTKTKQTKSVLVSGLKNQKSKTETTSSSRTKSGQEIETSIPTTTVDAAALATSISSGNKTGSVKHLSNLLNARVNYILNNANPEVRLNLKPQHLGNIQIRLISVGDTTVVRMQAENKSVGSLLEQAAPQLVQQLQKSGLVVDQVNIDYGGMDFEQGDGTSEQANKDNEDFDFFDTKDGNSDMEQMNQAMSERISSHDGEIDVVA